MYVDIYTHIYVYTCVSFIARQHFTNDSHVAYLRPCLDNVPVNGLSTGSNICRGAYDSNIAHGELALQGFIWSTSDAPLTSVVSIDTYMCMYRNACTYYSLNVYIHVLLRTFGYLCLFKNCRNNIQSLPHICEWTHAHTCMYTCNHVCMVADK